TLSGGRLKLNYFSPKAWLARKGITPGTTPPVVPGIVVKPVASVTPVAKPAAKPKATSANRRIQKALKGMGIWSGAITGVNDAKQKAGVKAFQEAHGLVPDKVWGAKTDAHWKLNKRIQTAMNRWKSVTPKLKADGYIGSPSRRAVKQIKTSNKGGAWKSTDTGATITTAFLTLIGVK
ncbi:peptidoglycan-binding domain-containing protein, partial [Thermocatellispora tengchongensis]